MTDTNAAPLKENEMKVKVSIVEDDSGIRASLVRLLRRSSGFQCLDCFSSAEEALQEIPKTSPDVVLMDINLPGMDGVECVRRIKTLQPALQILMLTVYDDPQRIFEALASGATGYMMKHTPPLELLEAIRDVHQGGAPMNSQIARKVVESFRKHAPAQNSEQLSPREKEILELLAQGYLIKEIADQIGIGFGTVRSHIRGIYEKLHVHSRAQAVALFLGAHPKLGDS
jgi:DNA-binding NarL/FixJ family response regulator